jgi:hypothetical protein
MKKIKGITYLTAKEVAHRHGYSESWLQKRRLKKLPPIFGRYKNNGKVYYPLIETDEWFENFFIINQG